MLRKNSLYEKLVYVRYLILILGILITSYLIYVNNFSDIDLSCGRIGDCNKVQNSSYGFLLGIPVTFFGLAYFCFLVGLYSNYFLRKKFVSFHFMELVGFSVSLSAFIFSMYLTYIELFVINEICLWCITIATFSTFIFIINLYSLISIKNYV
tara:strand:+ start:3787 stop:4245 length:459 start_codon:yes stop_codon:yes gene_type:complete